MRFVTFAAALLLVVGTAACGEGTHFAANRPTPGGQSSNAQGGRRGLAFGFSTPRQELDSRGVRCGQPPAGEHQLGPVLYQKNCQ